MSTVACIVAGATRANADEAPKPVHLRFEVEEALAGQCPDQERFMQLLRAEQPKLTLAPEGVRARTFHVRIRRAQGALAGEVVVSASSGASYTRSVEAHDCGTLTRALAVVAALASNVVPFDEPPEGDHAPVVPEARTSDDGSEADAPAPPPPQRRASTELRGERLAAKPRPPPTWLGGAGIGTELALGTLPRPAMGYRAHIDARRTVGANAVGARASFAYAAAALPGPSSLNVLVRTWTARVEGCVSRTASVVSIEGCLGATTGVFEASSRGLGVDVTDVNPWLAFGLGVRGRWHIARSLYSELFSNVSVPTTTFDTVSRGGPLVVRYSVSPVVGEVGLGLGISFSGP